jgi:hypothetical protein
LNIVDKNTSTSHNYNNDNSNDGNSRNDKNDDGNANSENKNNNLNHDNKYDNDDKGNDRVNTSIDRNEKQSNSHVDKAKDVDFHVINVNKGDSDEPVAHGYAPGYAGPTFNELMRRITPLEKKFPDTLGNGSKKNTKDRSQSREKIKKINLVA